MMEEIFDNQSQEIDSSLIDILRELEQKRREQRQIKLDELGRKLAKTRNEAINERAASGFEQIWREDEEYYNGIDDLNRSSTQYIKPRTTGGGLVSTHKNTNGDAQCTEFLNITRPFCDAAEARMCDMLLPQNDWPFHIKPTPVPDLDQAAKSESQLIDPATGQPFAVSDIAKARKQEISEKVEKAADQIKDWLIQSEYKTVNRHVMANAVQVGTGILKGPFPSKCNLTKYEQGRLVEIEQIFPDVKCVSHWDFFPDMNGGEEIQECDYVFERDYMTARQLRNLDGVPGYESDAIKKVLKEGPGQRNINSHQQADTLDNDRFEVWYYYGSIDNGDLEELDENYACECEDERKKLDDGEEEEREPVNAIVVMVNDTVIKGVKSPLGNYGYPFDVMVWKRVSNQLFGAGVAREGRAAQKTVLASFRTLMENMGLASVPMLALLRSALIPAENGNYSIHKGKRWFINEDAGIRNVSEAIQAIIIPSMQKELTEMIQLGMKMMEDATGITFLMQGQQGSAPDTVGGMQMMLQNSSTVLRNVARIYDQKVTIPNINRHYKWLLMHGDDDMKADLQIEATGASSLVEREIQAMFMPQILQMVSTNPGLEGSPKKAFHEWLKSMKFDPSKFDMDEQEKQAMAEQQPPVDPRVQVEQMRIEKDMQIAQMKSEIDQMKIQKDVDRDALYSQGVTERNQITYEAQIRELELRKELAMLQYAMQQQMQLEDIKAKLSDSAMKLSVQKELANINTQPAKQVLPAPSEPPQRAPAGRAFQE